MLNNTSGSIKHGNNMRHRCLNCSLWAGRASRSRHAIRGIVSRSIMYFFPLVIVRRPYDRSRELFIHQVLTIADYTLMYDFTCHSKVGNEQKVCLARILARHTLAISQRERLTEENDSRHEILKTLRYLFPNLVLRVSIDT